MGKWWDAQRRVRCYIPENGRPVGRPYGENRVFARWSVQKLEHIFKVTLA